MVSKLDRTYSRWTPGAIECYQRRGVCEGCLTGQIMEQRCRMKSTVIELVKLLGPPKIYENLIPGATRKEEDIVAAILEGAKTLKQIADNLELSEATIQQRLYSLYKLIEDKGYQFKTSKRRNRLPEFIWYVKTLQPNDNTPDPNIILDEETELKGKEIMYDKDLNLEYPNYMAPIIDAIKKGYEKVADIANQSGVGNVSVSVTINQFAHRLQKLELITLKKEISSRQTVINFIQSRLLDPEYKEEIAPPQPQDQSDIDIPIYEKLTEKENIIIDLLLNGLSYKQIAEKLVISSTTVKTYIANIFSKRNYHSLQELLVQEFKRKGAIEQLPKEQTEISALKTENEELRKRVEELEKQPKTLDLSSIKAKINEQIASLTQKLEVIETLEKEEI